MKLENRPGIIPSLFFIIAALCSPAFAAIDGPEVIAAGELAIFQTDVPAAWAVVPDTYAKSVVVDSSGEKLVFASPVKGTVTIIAATAGIEGKPNIEVRTFINGEKSDGADNGEDEQPEDKLIALVKSEFQKIENKEAAETGKQKLADVFQTVVDFIDKKTVQTPAGARETFRRYWEFETARIGKGTLDAYRPFLSAVSDAIDWSTIQTVRADFIKVGLGLSEAARADQQQAPSSGTKTETPKPTQTQQQPKSSCPGGNCPTGGRFFYRF